MTKHRFSVIALAGALAATAAPASAQMQGPEGYGEREDDDGRSSERGAQRRVEVTPYIEAGQVLLQEISPGSDTVTYTQVGAGVDAAVNTRSTQGSASLRYEHQFGWDGVSDRDNVTGVARVATQVVPGSVQFDAGALAAQSRVSSEGQLTLNGLDDRDLTSNVYTAYAGPTVRGRIGEADASANYRIGYTRVDSPDAVAFDDTGTARAIDVFDESVAQSAQANIGFQPGEYLPVGLGVGAGYYQEDISNLDQRVRDMFVRGDVTVPVADALAVVAGVGYEKVEVSSRDAVRDMAGVPVLDADGSFIVDDSVPRTIAYETDGIIYDVGVVWRPSNRTALEAHVGRRYDSTTYYGSFAWAPNRNESVTVGVYDAVSGFGGRLNSAVANLPTDFEATRNVITGDMTGCLGAEPDGRASTTQACIPGAFGSIRSAVFRNRGVAMNYARKVGRTTSAGLGAGYDRRTFFAAPGTVLEAAADAADENIWANAYLGGEIDRRSSFSTNLYANWLRSGFAQDGDAVNVGANAAYRRFLTRALVATAALGVDGVDADALPEDVWTTSAALGLRYQF